MKKFVVLFCLMFVFVAFSTAQNYGSWVIPYDYSTFDAYELEFSQNQVQPNLLIGLPAFITYRYSAGGFGQNGNLLFYVVDKQVFDASTNISIGNFHNYDETDMHQEVQVIMKPESDTMFYIIFSSVFPTDDGVLTDQAFLYTEVLYDPVDNKVSFGNVAEQLYYYNSSSESGAMAISKLNNNGERELYRCTKTNGITKTMITPSGISTNPVLILNKNNSTIGLAKNFGSYNFEMKVNNAGHTIFAWNTMDYQTIPYIINDKDKVFIYNMTTDEVKKIDIDPNSVGEIGGIEFSNFYDNILYVSYNSEGSGSGLIALDYENETTTMIATNEYSHTFLQHAPDGNIYGVSNNGTNFCRINDLVNGNFTPVAFSNGTVISFIERSGTNYYILPENEKMLLNLTATSGNIDCEGNTNGWVAAGAIGGVAPYSYEWSDEFGNVISTQPDVDDLGEGTYMCCVTDFDSPPAIICQTVYIIVDHSLLPFDYEDEIRLVEYNPANTVTNWSSLQASGFYEFGIRIESGQTLNIASGSFMEFHEDAIIIVEPGATLNIVGSTLTNYAECPFRWQGIEVWGNYGESQLVDPSNGIQHQGKLILNGTTIEHAKIAVNLTNPDFWLGNNGGIVQAENSTFRNNRRALHTMKYENDHPVTGKPMDNLSYFKYCNFVIDDEYMAEVVFHKHVDMVETDGIKFKACSFSLEEGTLGVSNYNQAIASYNAGFDVMGVCVISPCTNGDPSTFTGFYRGINASNNGLNNYTFSVGLSEFTDNATGIYASGVNYLSVLFSKFNVGYNAINQEECESKGKLASGFGIDMEHCTGFAIEENEFYKTPGAPSGTYTGIRCKDSNTPYDLIYLNTFEGLSFGNFAEGKNRYLIGDDHDGLEYQCNINSENIVDFEVATDDPDNSPAMIRGYMGYTNISAGNTFSQQSNVEWHFLNLGTQQIDYWWYSGNSTGEPEYYCILPPDPNPYPDPCYFTPHNTSPENTCPSHYGGGGSGSSEERSVLLTPQQFQETELTYVGALTDFNNIKSLYENLEDGGNTQSLYSEVENAFPSDMWQLRSELLGVSPHVSKEVLKSAADKTEVFPESVLFEILSANPDELKNGDMISFLENKEQPLPEYMIEMLKQIADGVTYKTILKRQMADFHAQKSQAANDIIRSILADTEMDMQLYRNWLDNMGNIDADKQIIASYIEEGDYNSAQTLLNLIPSLYELDENRLLQYNDYKSLTEFLIVIEQQNRNIRELETGEIDFLDNLAEYSTGTAKSAARGILNFAYDYHYCNCLPESSAGMKSSAIEFEINEQDKGLYVNAEPNPAYSWVTISYRIPSYVDEAVLRITDIEGKQISTFYINAEQGQQLWDTRKIKSGTYLYSLEAGKFKKGGKLIIR